MTGQPRLLAYRDVLAVALGVYLVELRVRWGSPAADGDEVERVLAAVGAVPDPAEDARRRMRALLADTGDDPFARLADALGLSTGDQALAAAAWWAEADPQFAVLLGCAHDDRGRRCASAALVSLALRPFGVDVARVCDDDMPLVRWGVVEAGAGAAEPLRLTPTARAVIAGLPLRARADVPPPAPRLAAAVTALSRHLASPSPGPVVLRGPAGIGRHAVAVAACEGAGVAAVSGERPAAELRLLARSRIGVPVVAVGRLAELGWHDDGPIVAIAPAGEAVAGGYVVDLPGPDFRERERLWSAAVAGAGVDAPADLPAALASRFAFSDGDVEEAVARAGQDARWHERPLDEAAIWDAARRQPEHALRRLASLVTPAFTLDDLVLTGDARAQLAELVAHVELQHVVLDGWGFRRRLPRGQGVIALFGGPPGTGKTMAAEAVAHELRHDLYRVDLSAVVSKYIGETEKNLAAAFDEAERASAVLFFDEADSLFGKRTEVRDSHDRYANLEVNYLLQRVETFTGLVILASNRHHALDEAFVRRLRFVIRFDLPDADFRAELWRRAFPAGAALADLDWPALAGAELSGGSIQATALAASYLAAADGGVVTAAHVEHALRREYEKLGRAWTPVLGARA